MISKLILQSYLSILFLPSYRLFQINDTKLARSYKWKLLKGYVCILWIEKVGLGFQNQVQKKLFVAIYPSFACLPFFHFKIYENYFFEIFFTMIRQIISDFESHNLIFNNRHWNKSSIDFHINSFRFSDTIKFLIVCLLTFVGAPVIGKS